MGGVPDHFSDPWDLATEQIMACTNRGLSAVQTVKFVMFLPRKKCFCLDNLKIGASLGRGEARFQLPKDQFAREDLS